MHRHVVRLLLPQYRAAGAWPARARARARARVADRGCRGRAQNGRDVSLRDCYELAKVNPLCTRVVWKTAAYQDDPAVCQCWANTTGCARGRAWAGVLINIAA